MATDDDDVTRTADVDAAPPMPEPVVRRLAAPLQYRDPDRYEVVGEHGRGALGIVSRAHDRELGRNVAIKELLQRGDLGEVRFLREAMITARLEHPGIVPIHEAGRWPDGTPFYVMKLVAGRSLKELIAERATVEERIELLHHVIAVADAVAYAHKRKIIHRDLKPANVIAGDFGETVVIDWGLAKDLNAEDDAPVGGGTYRTAARDDLTVAGSILGTPLYMAPEQARGEPVDQRADVYAIGAMLWQLCSLQRVPPPDPQEIMHMLRRARIDADLGAIVVKALAPDPERRYRDAGELAADLRAFKSGARIAARHYSPLAMLARWIRRHRALAISVTAATALAIAGAIWFVRSIAIERDRADVQRARADAERDHARLSEAEALLEKDPTRARELLASLAIRSPRRALLLSRARRGAAAHVTRLKHRIMGLRAAEDVRELALVSANGELYELDPESGALRERDRGLVGPLVRGATRWIYARASGDATTIASTSGGSISDAGKLLAQPTSVLAYANRSMFAVEPSGELYRFEASGPVLVERNVRSIAGDEHVLLKCMRDGQLVVTKDGTEISRSTCATNESGWPMAVARGHHVSLRDAQTLALDDRTIAIPKPVSGEYEVALSGEGVAAFADFTDKAWFVRAGGDRLEPAPPHQATPLSVSARDHLVAWGYSDGSVVAVDTRGAMTWKYIGHPDGVNYVAITADGVRRRLVSASRKEVRIWDLTPSGVTSMAALPCSPFHIMASRNGAAHAIDCSDGRVLVWDESSGGIRELHRHADLAFGLARWNGLTCSGGWDGRVLCSAPNGSERQVALSGSSRIRWLTSCPDDACLVASTDDGKVWKLDGARRVLFSHRGKSSYRMAVSETGQLASVGWDGSLVLYDLAADREVSRIVAHTGLITSVAWRKTELWTAGADGMLKRWSTVPYLELRDTVNAGGGLTSLALVDDGWAAAIDQQMLVVASARQPSLIRLDLGRQIADIQVSPDQRYLAAAAFDEVIVIDRQRHRLTTIGAASGELACIRFIDSTTLAACGQSSIKSIAVDLSSFIAFEGSERKQP